MGALKAKDKDKDKSKDRCHMGQSQSKREQRSVSCGKRKSGAPQRRALEMVVGGRATNPDTNSPVAQRPNSALQSCLVACRIINQGEANVNAKEGGYTLLGLALLP